MKSRFICGIKLSFVFIIVCLSYSGVATGLDPDSVINTLIVERTPWEIVITSDGQYAYVLNKDSNSVSIIRTIDDTIVKTVSVGQNPYGITITPDGSFVYVSISDLNCVDVIQTTNNEKVHQIENVYKPYHMTCTPDGQYIYVINLQQDNLTKIRVSDNSIVNNHIALSVGSSPHSLKVTPDNAYLFVTNHYGDSFSIIDTSTDSVISEQSLGNGLTGVDITPDGQYLFISSTDEGKVYKILVSDITTLEEINVGSTPLAVAVTPDGQFVYVSVFAEDKVKKIRVADNFIVAEISVGDGPNRLAITPDGGKIYVPNRLADTVSVIGVFEPNQAPIASAGLDQSVHLGDLVSLDGSGSSDPDENYPLTYSWQITSKPAGSLAELDHPASLNPTFTADLIGDYTLELTVTDSLGAVSEPEEVWISTYNTAPTAEAGEDQAVTIVGTLVQLDGTQSFDEDGDPLTYAWEIISRPAGSAAELHDPASPTPSFTPDEYGDYEVQLVVSDTWTLSEPDSLTVSFSNLLPVADAGNNQAVDVGDTVSLDGSGSTDANGDAITYNWSLVSKPEGSLAEPDDPTAVAPSFLADKKGDYVLSLVVNDGLVSSEPSNVTVLAVYSQNSCVWILQELIATVNGLDNSVFKNKNMKKTMTNKVNATIEKVVSGEYREAINKLEHDLLGKTDGCTDSGSPDKNDWIRDCEAQGQVYSLIMEAVFCLNDMQ